MERISKSERILTAYQRYELLTGECCYPLAPYYSGYGDAERGQNLEPVDQYITEQMKLDWLNNREVLLKLWNGEINERETFGDAKPWLHIVHGPVEQPWACSVFDDQSPAAAKKAKRR